MILKSQSSGCMYEHNCECFVNCTGDEVKVVSTPPFAESVTEGDVKWSKGMHYAGFFLA